MADSFQCQECFGTGRNKKGGPCKTCRATGRVGGVAAGFAALGALLRLAFGLAVIVVVIIAIASCGGSSQDQASQPAACVTEAPGSKVCGDDAKNFCETMKLGQSVSTDNLDPETVSQCRAAGVPGLRTGF